MPTLSQCLSNNLNKCPFFFLSEIALRTPSSSGFFLDGNIHLECHFYWVGASSAVGFRLFVWDLWAFFIFMRVRLLAVLANISVFLE